jgi:hypothetical protein
MFCSPFKIDPSIDGGMGQTAHGDAKYLFYILKNNYLIGKSGFVKDDGVFYPLFLKIRFFYLSIKIIISGFCGRSVKSRSV